MKSYKTKFKKQRQITKEYKELFETAVNELRNKNMQVEFLLNSIDEVQTLVKKDVHNNIIDQVIENTKQRHFLDIIINNNLIGRGKK